MPKFKAGDRVKYQYSPSSMLRSIDLEGRCGTVTNYAFDQVAVVFDNYGIAYPLPTNLVLIDEGPFYKALREYISREISV